MITVGLLGVVAPRAAQAGFDWHKSNAGLKFAVVTNLVLGIVHIVAAPGCRISEPVFLLGVMLMIKAGSALVLGVLRKREAFISSIQTSLQPPVMRLLGLVWVCFGGFFVYASGWQAASVNCHRIYGIEYWQKCNANRRGNC